MNNPNHAKLFMKMARYDCMLLTVLEAAKYVLVAAAVINTVLSGMCIASAMKK